MTATVTPILTWGGVWAFIEFWLMLAVGALAVLFLVVGFIVVLHLIGVIE